MLWFFGLLVTAFLAVASICFGLAAFGALRDREHDDYAVNGIFGLGLAVCSAVLGAAAAAGLIALRAG